jgi:hypothetical protein
MDTLLRIPAIAVLQVRHFQSLALNKKLTADVLPVEKHHFRHPLPWLTRNKSNDDSEQAIALR